MPCAMKDVFGTVIVSTVLWMNTLLAKKVPVTQI